MGELITSLKEQGKAIMVMLGVAIISILAMIVLGFFNDVTKSLPGLGNGTSGINATVTITINLFIVSVGIVGSFAAICWLYPWGLL